MDAFNHQHYVASLRTKQGEFDAVKFLTPDVRERFTPLWEVQPSDATEEGDDPATALDAVIDGLPSKIHAASSGLEGFIDCGLLNAARRRSSGEHPVLWLCERTIGKGTALVPVVVLDSDSEYRSAATDVHVRLGVDVAIRIDVPHLSDYIAIGALITDLEISYKAAHLIIDCGHLEQQVAELFLPVVLPTLLRPIIALGDWKTVTLLSGAIPADYSGLGPGVVLVPRREWQLWLTLVSPGLLPRRPSFGDYAIAHPEYRFLPWYAQGAAKIRYTGQTMYSVFIGQSLKVPRYGGYAQFPALAQQVVRDPAYRGAGYSEGDRVLHDCASGQCGTGNLTTWVMVGTNQHATYAARLVTTIP